MPDGSLSLLQRVEDQGQPVHIRRWLIRQMTPGHFSGSMSDALGPVTIDQEGAQYRFRFKMKGGLSVEQRLTSLLEGGLSATTDMTVRKFGMTVASSHGIVRKLIPMPGWCRGSARCNRGKRAREGPRFQVRRSGA